ncbi:DUF2612 domain-containing protein [Laribacter hongkongensis]|uniref:DUF2612 domain-containing protein n=1 Tax=Laribacter hongkongensis TaxID=168471 RepID=UPI001EFE584E|nr:DUF2612 domain-containing protein [Laribacter hongkongensis]MCG9064729.1 DUF2612 domain-containing protein [Laribacter hongkongensis]
MSYDKLLIWQYQGKPRAAATARLINDQFASTWAGLAALPDALDINVATGVNLDLCGKHVGQSRVLQGLAPRGLFGFRGASGAKGFNKSGMGGGKWYRSGDPTTESVTLGDDDYRFLIRCRIARNYQVGTIDDISDALEFIFGSESAVFDQYDMSLSVLVRSDNISDFKRYAVKELDILPRPNGVGINFYFAVPVQAFGFRGAPGARGFNKGRFARLL